MEYRQLGDSGLLVSSLTLGTMTLGGKGGFANVGTGGLDDAREHIAIALDAGVNLIDTADIYSDGESERLVGEALGARRDDVLLATKGRFATGPGVNDSGNSRHHLTRALEASLTRLGTDYVDLYQIHEWDGLTPLEETVAVLDEFVRSGKVRHIGASNLSGWQLLKALGLADVAGATRFVSHQIHYSLQAREAEFELLPAALDQGLGVMVWSPLAGGWLSGKYRRDSRPESGRQLTAWSEPPVYDQEKLWDVIDVLVDVAGAHGVSAAQVALAWLLTRPAIATVVIGARTTDQLRDNLAAATLELTDEDLDRLDDASRPDVPYPYWHQLWTASDRFGDIEDVTLGTYPRP